MKQAYEVLVGLSWPPDRRAEPGDVVTDLPTASIRHELAAGHIRPVPAPDAPADKKEAADGDRGE